MAVIDFEHSTDFQDYYEAQNLWSTVLTSDITASGITIPVSSVSGLSEKGWVSIETEHIFYDYINSGTNTLGSTTYPVVRGTDDSSAASHDAGAAVGQRINAGAFNALMTAVKKRKSYTFTSSQVSAGTISEQNITSFASRAAIRQLIVLATGGSTDFVIEFYRRDSFYGIDRLYKSTSLSSIETTLDASSSGIELPVTSTTGFFIDEFAEVNDVELFMIDDINAGVSLEAVDTISGSYSSGNTVVQGYEDISGFYYEDLDWTGEIHIKILNNDTSNPVTVKLRIVAEVSDEA